MIRSIDFNCDLGEGCGDDAAIVRCISSASIACGGHRGDAHSMRASIALCAEHGVRVGAHPSFEDREHFGRRPLDLPAAEVYGLVTRQIRSLATLCREADYPLSHVKPHGALYNLAADREDIASAIAQAVHDHDPALCLYGLAGSALIKAGRHIGLPVAEEVFAERAYADNGRLLPRDQAGALIEHVEDAAAQVRHMLREGVVISRQGMRIPIRADTLCLHGDRADAAAFARELRQTLRDEGFRIASPDSSRGIAQ